MTSDRARGWAAFIRIFAAIGVSAFAVSASAPSVAAQRPAGADTLSSAAVAESLKVLGQVRKQLDKDRNNGPLWYRRGMLAWALYDRDRTNGGLRELDWTRLGREADSSIRLAARISPDSIRYRLTQGQYYLATGWIPVRVQAYFVFDGALKAARRVGDSLLLAEALVEKGRIHWRRYDPADFGSVPGDVRQRAYTLLHDSAQGKIIEHDVDTVTSGVPLTREALRAARGELLEAFRRGDGGFSNESDYKKAEEFFREAYTVAPSFKRGYLQLAMLLAERERWTELNALARQRIAQNPDDAWAWMTAGLASHRAGQAKFAQVAFDSGFALLPAGERARLDNIQRLARPTDEHVVAGWSATRKSAEADRYWQWAAPLWSRNSTNPRLEFLARVTYAELRWTVDEMRKRGADSDRGRVHIRYGPADARFSADDVEGWWYDFPRLTFHFVGMPTFGTSYFSDPNYAWDMMDSIPVRWDNIARERIDSLPVRVSRFRAINDSVDVVFASQPPVDAILAASSLAGAVRTDFWLLDALLRPVLRDSGTMTAAAPRAFVRRFAPGTYGYRFEASAEGSLRAARAASSFRTDADPSSAFTTRGFGMSDVLVASRVEPRAGTRRWSDFDYTAHAGTVRLNTEVSLLWENYDFEARDGSSEYEITLTIARRYESLLNRVRARVVSSFSTMLGDEQTADRLIYRYGRTTGHAPVITDYITLVLTDLPSGDYDLTLGLLDKVSGRTTSRTIRMMIRE